MGSMADNTSTAQRRTELRKAVLDLTERGLYTAAKWAAEQLAGKDLSRSIDQPMADHVKGHSICVDEL